MTPSGQAGGPAVRPLVASDVVRACELLARAFRDNALNAAVIRSDDPERRYRCNLHGMRALLPVARSHGRVLVATANGALAGALVASQPGGFPLPAPSVVQRLRTLVGQGLGVTRRWEEVYEALEALHPLETHWYLGTLGVDPPLQGRGIGAGLLAHWLAGVDREGFPAYLETDAAHNVGFYERAGFCVEGETEVLGVRIWRMLRPAAASRPEGARPAGRDAPARPS